MRQLPEIEKYIGLYHKAWREYQRTEVLGDKILYDLCTKEFPGHLNKRQVYTKVWFIGYTYSAGLSRQIGKNVNSAVVSALVTAEKAEKEISNIIEKIAGLTEPLSLGKLPLIVESHEKLLRIIEERVGVRLVSFTSKYLHFHHPYPSPVPVYDRVSQMTLRWLYGLVEYNYGRFVDRFWQLYRYLLNRGVDATFKGMDRFLLRLSAQSDFKKWLAARGKRSKG
jgi:hypothetical protein